jgi:hypothetical protein
MAREWLGSAGTFPYMRQVSLLRAEHGRAYTGTHLCALNSIGSERIRANVGNKKREQVESTGKVDTAELAVKGTPAERRHGEGAASALDFMKRLEHDRAKVRPRDERPAS